MKIAYIEKRFQARTLAAIDAVNVIVAEYEAQGLKLSLRQLFYQHVARGMIPNTERAYKRLGNLVGNGRKAGLIDWDAIEDRTRNLTSYRTFNSAAQAARWAAEQFAMDLWADQAHYVEVWVEKEALVGVIGRICEPLRVPFFSCRGYVSLSTIHEAAQRLRAESQGRTCVVLHLGDHDPSGFDMTRDNRDRLELFEAMIEFRRIALNMDQVEAHDPPPNPVKVKDSRAPGYIAQHGRESWELDALDPASLRDLIEASVAEYRDEAAWRKSVTVEKRERGKLLDAASASRGAFERRQHLR